MFTSLRSRLALVAFVAMLVASAVGGVLFMGLLERSLIAEVDQSIINRSFDVSIEISVTNELDSASFPTDPETFVGIVEDPLGQPLLDIHNDDQPQVNEVMAVFTSSGGLLDVPTDASIESITLTEGSDNLRIVFTDVDDGNELVAVARTLDGVDRTLADIRTVVLLAVPMLALLVAGLVYALAGRSLQPVERIRADVDAISAGDLSQRVLVDGRPSAVDRNEISRLGATMNMMLGRLEAAQSTQQRFTSDAAHELRTPLASMRAQLEVGLAHPTETDWPETAGQVHADVDRMQRLVDDLLTLARSDGRSGEVSVSERLVDLDELILAEAAAVVRRPDVHIDVSGVSGATVRGNEDDLRRVVSNLLTNAVRHAERSVVVTAKEADGEAIVCVSDDGSGVPEADRDRIFERFVRLDEARTREAGGAGLGLALSSEIAEAHRGTLTVETSDFGGACFVLRLPAAAVN